MDQCKTTIEKLSKLVSIPTVSDPLRGKRTTREQALQVKSVLEGDYTLLTESPSPILLLVRGEGKPVTLWLAHYDVVPPGPGWITDPFKPRVSEGKLFGRGAADDKSNVAALDSALANYTPEKGTLILAFTGDEEIGGASAEWLRDHLISRGLKPDYLVNGDGSLSRVIIRRRAGFTLTIRVEEKHETVTGKNVRLEAKARLARDTMHSAYFIPGVDLHPLVFLSLKLRDLDLYAVELEGDWVKSNVIPGRAVLAAVRNGSGDAYTVDIGLTAAIRSLLPLSRAPIPTEKYSDYGVNINPNIYYKHNNIHTFKIDIRAMTVDHETITNAITDILEENIGLEGLSYSFELHGGKGYLYTSRESLLVKKALKINSSLGLPAVPIEAGGASDSRYFSPHGIEAIDYGPLGANIHGPNEYVSLDNLCKAVVFYRRLAESLHSRAG